MTTLSLSPLRLHLIRHGETEARELAKFLAHVSFAQVLSSPFKRALKTGREYNSKADVTAK